MSAQSFDKIGPDKIGPDKIGEKIGGKIGPQRIYEVCTVLS